MRVRSSGGLAFVILLGCGASEFDQLRSRAAFEFDCPEREIQIKNLDDESNAFGVSGCGKRAVYLYDCPDYDCRWILNSARE